MLDGRGHWGGKQSTIAALINVIQHVEATV